MEPTSSPDNSRSSRGLSRFWPVNRESEDEAAADEPPAETVARPGEMDGETEMVALGTRRATADNGLLPPGGISGPATGGISGPAPGGISGPATGGISGLATGGLRGPATGGTHGPGTALSPYASAHGPGGAPTPDGPKPLGPIGPATPGRSSGGPATPRDGVPAARGPVPGEPNGPAPGGLHGTPDDESDNSGASEPGEDANGHVESRRRNPWDRDTGAFGGFGLSGRNGRFLFGGRTVAGESRPGPNGHSAPELNGRTRTPDDAPSTVDAPPPGEPSGDAGLADPIDENGRDDMNGRAGIPGFPAAGESSPADERTVADAAGRRDRGDAEPGLEARRQATGWASVPTSKHPVVNPTSGAPASGPPASGLPASGLPASGLPASGLPTSGQPTSGAPASGPPARPSGSAPVSPGFGRGSAYGQPPSYVPALPDPAAGPVSGVPTPRGSAGLSALGESPDQAAGQATTAEPGAKSGLGKRAAKTQPGEQTGTPGAGEQAVAAGRGEQPDAGGLGERAGQTGLGDRTATPGHGERTATAGLGDRTGTAGFGERAATAGLSDHTATAGLGERAATAGLGDHTATAGLGDRAGTGGLGERATAAGLGERAAGRGLGERTAGGGGLGERADKAEESTGRRAAHAGASTAAAVASIDTEEAEPRHSPGQGGRRAREDDDTPRAPAPRRSASLEDAEPVRRGRRAAPDPDEPGLEHEHEQRPGDVAAGHIAFWDDDATRHFRAAWHEVKAEFVDDPVRALTRAHDLLTDAVNELTEALLAERDELDPLRGTDTPDTESMRMAMRGYREFLDRILAL